MQIKDLFPIPLGVFELNREISQIEYDCINNQEMVENMGNMTSVDNFILEQKELKELRNFFQESIDTYFTEIYSPEQDTHLRITQSWCNYTEPGQFHHKHCHSNSFISGVFYFQAKKESDKLYFYKDGFQQLKTPVKDYNPYNSDSWWMEAYTGRLFVFPSSLPHMVETVQGEGLRISLSFNTFPVGNFGHLKSLTGLTL